MKKLYLFIALLVSIVTMAQNREPFAPVGTTWKYWFADEFTTGYINVKVGAIVPKTGVISGTEEEITVDCSEIYVPRGLFAFASESPVEETPISELNPETAKYMFKDGNKAYIYDKYNATFYKLIDMDANPGDTWEMSLFNGKYNNEYDRTVFNHDPADGVPSELLPYFHAYRTKCITDQNWACNLDFPAFKDSLLNNGITQEQIDAWKASANCITTGNATAGSEHELYTKATTLLDAKGYAWTPETWACDFKYYHFNVQQFSWSEVSTTEKNTIFALCETDLNTMDAPMPMPTEIESLWQKFDKYDATGTANSKFKLVTKYNWPDYVKLIAYDIKKSVADGGLGLTAEEVETLYTGTVEYVYNQVPQPSQVDLIQVSEKNTITVGETEIPVVVMSSACTSLLDPEALRSNVSIYGALNINYLNLYGEPWPTMNEGGSSYEIHYFGLLCSDHGEYSIETPKLDEYFSVALKDKYAAGEVSCGEIEAPKFELSAAKAVEANQGDNPFGSIDTNVPAKLKNGTVNTNLETRYVVNTVVHVVHNEANPQGKITSEQINEMIKNINDAFTGNNDQNDVHESFATVVGHPAITLKLANVDPQGQTTSGIIYHTTDVEYYTVGSGSSIEEQYAFKFDDIGMPYNWDHTKYLNIYIADLGGKDGLNVGGFVTNPEPNASNDADYTTWLESNDLNFWKNWINDPEGDARFLDGLSLDYYATFLAEGLSEKIKYKTAIHELGHYFGLKHTFALVKEVVIGRYPWGAPIYGEVMYGDNMDDTPEQYYKTIVYDNCSRELYQCGNLIQINNFMDYSLPCACMFTVNQAEFMRTFTETLRPGIYSELEYDTGINEILEDVEVCPNPTNGMFTITMNSQSPYSYAVFGTKGELIQKEDNVFMQVQVSLKDQPTGIYMVKVVADGQSAVYKVVKQ